MNLIRRKSEKAKLRNSLQKNRPVISKKDKVIKVKERVREGYC